MKTRVRTSSKLDDGIGSIRLGSIASAYAEARHEAQAEHKSVGGGQGWPMKFDPAPRPPKIDEKEHKDEFMRDTLQSFAYSGSAAKSRATILLQLAPAITSIKFRSPSLCCYSSFLLVYSKRFCFQQFFSLQ